MTKLDMSLQHHPKGYRNNHIYDGVLRAIAANMPHLKCLDISYCIVEPEAIEHLLPTEDNTLGGCPELVELNLNGILRVDADLLKKIILVLPKLKVLSNELLVHALVDLTDDEMDVDTARSLYIVDLFVDPKHFEHLSPVRFDSLAKSPVFQRLRNNITHVYIATDKGEQNRSAFIASVLMSLTKLRYLQLWGISETHKLFLPVFKSIGDRLQYLSLYNTFESISVQDITRTCPKLTRLKLKRCQEDDASPRNGINLHSDQIEKPRKQPVLHCLTSIYLGKMGEQVCSADVLIALLLSPNLNHIRLEYLEALSDDVMFKVLSSPGRAALSNVTEFIVYDCLLITEAPFVEWLDRENCSLQRLRFSKCENVDCKTLSVAVEKYPRAVNINGV